MKKRTKIGIPVLAFALAFVSCEKFLDEMPDNRARLDDENKITKLLVSAYPETFYGMVAEFSSDNVDDYGANNPWTERILEEVFRWEDVTEIGSSDAPAELWAACYLAISSANEALAAIEEMGNPASLNPQRGEALLARAYSHFVLVNVFAMHYSKDHAATDLGITYMLAPERTLDPKYERNTVAEVYDHIKADIAAGLPLIEDGTYGNTPKFHMNRAAAHAFAARVALYTEDWNEAVRYANLAIGTNPKPNMRDNAAIAAASTDQEAASIAFASSRSKSNLFLSTAPSSMGLYFGAYYIGARFSHGSTINTTETWFASTPWGKPGSSLAYMPRLYIYTATDLDKSLAPRASYMFELMDPVARIGYRRTIYAPFNVEETLLVRAEANIHLKKYDEAFADMKLWADNNIANVPADFSIDRIDTWAAATAYYTPTAPTAKKKLSPTFTVEAGRQENMLHALLLMRRLETMHLGLRWFDIKRYGIEVARRVTKLTARDKRHALQLPKDVITAGLTPNRQ